MAKFLNTSRPKIISIEGNIGAGKTTIIEYLMNTYPGIVYMKEPVDLWETIRDADGETILSKFYESPHSYAFPFQVMAYTTRLAALKNIIEQNPTASVILCERSLEADKHIFAQMLHDDGKIDNINFQIYTQLYNQFSESYLVDGIIHLDVDPYTCKDRIINRNRHGEDNISLDYLIKCDEYHKKWLYSNKHTNVLRLNINTDVDFSKDEEFIPAIKLYINSFILSAVV